MAHFAEIDSNNVVLRVLVIADEHEHRGQEFLANDCNLGGTWIQTSYNNNTRKKFASTGDFYNAQIDAFIPPQVYPSWTFDNTDWDWKAPAPYPTDGKAHKWDESTLSWIEDN